MADQVRRLELTHLGLEALPQVVLGSVASREWNNAFQASLIAATQGLLQVTASYEAAALAAQSASNLPLPATSPYEASTLADVLSALCKASGANLGFAFAPDSSSTITALDEYADVLRQYHAEIARLSVAYVDDSEQTVDHGRLAVQWAATADKFWFFESLARRKVAKELARMCSKIPGKDDVARSSGYGTLKHELTKQRRHKPVRQLAEEMGGDFNTLAPCMLMSPLSIAQYLPATQELFDIVIFDEASQITPWDAVGSIARGKRTGSAIADRVERIGRKLFHYRQENSGRIFVWRDEAHCDAIATWREPSDEDRKRPIEDIPQEEIILAARDFLFEDDVPRAIAVAFGFSRLRAPSRERIEQALQGQDDSAASSDEEALETESLSGPSMISSRVTEGEVQTEILRLMSDGKPWTNSELKGALKSILPLSPADSERASHRPNEEKWEELVNNALSAARGNSLYGKGLIENMGRGIHRLCNSTPRSK